MTGDTDDEQREDVEDEEEEHGGNASLSERVLCADGECIGVIGPDGRCKECGRTLKEAGAGSGDDEEEGDEEDEEGDEEDEDEEEGDEEEEEGDEGDEEDEEDAEDGEDGEEDGGEEEDQEEDDSPPDFASRVLCADGACIGVIGPDGRCKECGRTPEEAAADSEHEGEDV